MTGASRGIGAAIARTLARDGATSSASTSPPRARTLAEVANEIGGASLQLDITDDGRAGALAEHLRERHGGADVVVHNAGITRDKTLGRMTDEASGTWCSRST